MNLHFITIFKIYSITRNTKKKCFFFYMVSLISTYQVVNRFIGLMSIEWINERRKGKRPFVVVGLFDQNKYWNGWAIAVIAFGFFWCFILVEQPIPHPKKTECHRQSVFINESSMCCVQITTCWGDFQTFQMPFSLPSNKTHSKERWFERFYQGSI